MSAATSATVRNRSSARGRSPPALVADMLHRLLHAPAPASPPAQPFHACTNSKRSGVTAAGHGAGGTNRVDPNGPTACTVPASAADTAQQVSRQRRVVLRSDVVVQWYRHRHFALFRADEQ